MAFPANPTDGQTHTQGGTTWTYEATGPEPPVGWNVTGSSGGGPSGAVDSVNGQTGDVDVFDPAIGAASDADLDSHTGNTSNPHSVTKSQVGLGNVDNTSDANKPVSTATQTALDGKSSTSHNHDGTYATASHNHAASEVTSGTLGIARIPTGTSSSTVCIGNDSRLSDSRTPTSHNHAGSEITSGTVAFARLPTGTSSTQVATGDHGHSDLVAKAAGIVTVDAGTNLSTSRPSGADVVYWMFDSGTDVGTGGADIVNAQTHDLYSVADA